MTENYLAVVMQEIVEVAGDPSLTMERLADSLGMLYQDAEAREEEQALAVITQAWELANAIQQQAGHAINMAATSKELLEMMQLQRDEAKDKAEALQALKDAIDVNDINHPDVQNFVEAVEESLRDEIESDLQWEYDEEYASQVIDQMDQDRWEMMTEGWTTLLTDMGEAVPDQLNTIIQWLEEKFRGETDFTAEQMRHFLAILRIEETLQIERKRVSDAHWAKMRADREAQLKAVKNG